MSFDQLERSNYDGVPTTLYEFAIGDTARWRYATGTDVDAKIDWLRRQMQSIAGGLALDDYVRVDASVGCRAFKQVRFFARAQNLFDRSYEELPGYRTPGRLVSVGAALTF